MLYCPKCKREYDKNSELCGHCGTKQVESFDDESEMPNNDIAFLINAADEIQANIFISKLSAFGIPVMKKYKELGSYLTIVAGNTFYGVDLYVPSNVLSDARNIIDQVSDDEIEFDSMLNEYGFEDIDNMNFEESEPKKVNNKQLDIKNTLDLPHQNYQNVRTNTANKKNNEILSKNILRIIAFIMVIFLGITFIYTVFQTIKMILNFL